MSTLLSRSCWVTVWERLNEQGVWEHNHISEGFENGVLPPGKADHQWCKGTWRCHYKLIDDAGQLSDPPYANLSLR